VGGVGEPLERTDIGQRRKNCGPGENHENNDVNPVVKLIDRTYEKGIKLTQNAVKLLEKMMDRVQGIEKWAVDIPCY
jgi:hypothetical protein